MTIETANGHKIGINERLKEATHQNTVSDLLAKARKFRHINPKTLRRAERVAAARIKELAAEAATKKAKKP